MGIVFFCNLVPRKTGAFENFLIKLGEKCRRSGDRLVLALGGEPSRDVADLWKRSGLEWMVLEGWTDADGREHPWRFCAPAIRILKKVRPEVAAVHFGNELPSLAVSLMAPLCGAYGIKWVWQQDQQISEPSAVSRHISRLRLVGLLFNHLVAAYDGGRKSMLTRRVSDRKITVIHNSVGAYRRERPEGWLRKELTIDKSDRILVSVGSLIPRKRIDFLIRAVAKLVKSEMCNHASLTSFAGQEVQGKREEVISVRSAVCSQLQDGKRIEDARFEHSIIREEGGDDSRIRDSMIRRNKEMQQHLTSEMTNDRINESLFLLVVGTGPQETFLKALADELGVKERVVFMGVRNDVRDIMAEADIYVHASLAETCTYAITEAMSVGIPAVVTEAGAAREQIEDGQSGYVVERDNLNDFVHRVQLLLESDGKRVAMGCMAKRKWEEKLTVENQAAAYYALYHSLAEMSL